MATLLPAQAVDGVEAEGQASRGARQQGAAAVLNPVGPRDNVPDDGLVGAVILVAPLLDEPQPRSQVVVAPADINAGNCLPSA